MIIIKVMQYDHLIHSFHYTVGGDLSKIHIPKDDELDEMVRRMEKFDEAPKKGEEHDTPGKSAFVFVVCHGVFNMKVKCAMTS